MYSEEQIFANFKVGHIEAFYKQIYPHLLAYASRRLSANYAFLAEDCVQNAIFKTYQNISNLDSYQTFKSFLFTCIHNEIISIFRHNEAKDSYVAQLEEEESQSFMNSLIEKETLSMLYDAIDELPERLRRIFDLNFEQGLKNTEIAELLNLSESAVKKQKAQMIEELRLILLKKTNNDLSALSILLPLLMI